jgi:hypothetical protein
VSKKASSPLHYTQDAIAAPFDYPAQPEQMMEVEVVAVHAAVHQWGKQLA